MNGVAALALGGLIVAGACAPAYGPSPVEAPVAPAVAVRPDCAPGVDVVVWAWESTPCDLDGSQTLVELGLPNEAACDDRGGVWVYEACEGVDY